LPQDAESACRHTYGLEVRPPILDAVRALPAEKQQEILSHAARLRDELVKKKPFKSVRGLWADLGISLSAGEIEGNQRDMWKNFPRDDI
jgi:hypothetical protein